MKWIIASDIHGSLFYTQKLLEMFHEEKAEHLLLLGDILYHGPRNDLPKEYNPKGVISLLNGMKDSIICVRGNCDSEVDEMVLDFPLSAPYIVIDTRNHLIFCTHGHLFSEDEHLKLPKGSIMIAGHTHVPTVRKYEKYTYLNTGSVSMPKENSWNSCVVFDGHRFVWKDLITKEKKLSFQLPLGF